MHGYDFLKNCGSVRLKKRQIRRFKLRFQNSKQFYCPINYVMESCPHVNNNITVIGQGTTARELYIFLAQSRPFTCALSGLSNVWTWANRLAFASARELKIGRILPKICRGANYYYYLLLSSLSTIYKKNSNRAWAACWVRKKKNPDLERHARYPSSLPIPCGLRAALAVFYQLIS